MGNSLTAIQVKSIARKFDTIWGMSGHSKWATIHRQKGINDAKKGAAFTKLANMITIAVKEGGGIGDPNTNFKLRLVIDKAREVNMPKDNIQRAIDRATGAGGIDLSEAMFEGFLPGGAGVLVQTLSDNKVRSLQYVRDAIERSGGTLANSGAVSHGFMHVGELRIKAKDANKSRDDQQLEIIDAGIEDMEDDGEGGFVVWCDKSSLYETKTKLESMGYLVSSAELSMKPSMYIEVSDSETKQKIETILEKLDDLDDVSHVWTNYQPV